MERSKYALLFSGECTRNENVLEYVKKQVQKHNLICEMDQFIHSVTSNPSNSSVLITATFDSLAKEVFT